MRRVYVAALAALAWGMPVFAFASGPYEVGSWPYMASDRAAQSVGDSITILIYEASTVQNIAQTGSQRDTRIGGKLNWGASSERSGQLGLDRKFDNSAQATRSGKLVAQITVTVDAILPNGDLHVMGGQTLNLSGEKTRIGLQGRLRREDISPDNTALSTRLADALIDYNGTGFLSRGSQPGVVGRVFNWLGLP